MAISASKVLNMFEKLTYRWGGGHQTYAFA
jgi:hypothetical protein